MTRGELERKRAHWLAFQAAVTAYDGPIFVYPDDFVELLRNVSGKHPADGKEA